MKIALSILLSLAVLLSVCGCKKSATLSNTSSDNQSFVEVIQSNSSDKAGKTEYSEDNTPSSDEDEYYTVTEKRSVATKKDIDNCKNGKHRYNAATCTEPATCMYCNATKGSPAGHVFTNGNAVCIVCGAHGDNWKNWYSENNYEITRAQVANIMSASYKKPKNVIVMIGDGMGPNDLILAEQYSADKYSFGLVLNQFKNTGFATTYALNSSVTDSAASGTALGTGSKTNVGVIGMTPQGENLENVSEVARSCGKKVGIVTNDVVIGATPSAYTVHNADRTKGKEIAKSFVEFAPDVLIGQGYSDFAKLDLKNMCVSTSLGDINEALNTDNAVKKPYFGFFEENTFAEVRNSLAYYTEVALNRLKNDKGFFLMIENAGTDFAGHSQDINGKVKAVVTFDRAVAVVLKFMEKNPDTLLIITSDHDNGGVAVPKDGQWLSKELFTASGHTGADVRTFALGYGSEYFKGTTVDNTDIGKFVKKALKGEW